jgi:hypothetical protein
MLTLLTLLGCSDEGDDSSQRVDAPTVAWLAPMDGETVKAGDVSCSVVISGFLLEDPAKHNEGEPEGYVAIGLDGTEALKSGDTTFTLALAKGAHALTAALHYADGDEVMGDGEHVCGAGDETGCAPIAETIDVMVE